MRILVLISFILIELLSRQNTRLQINKATRVQAIIQTYTEHEWWLLPWAANDPVCQILTEETDLPSIGEIKADCTPEVYELWLSHPLCAPAAGGGDASACPGLYLHYIGSQEKQREVIVELPSASAMISIEGCTRADHFALCPPFSSLLIKGIEPLEGYRITQIPYETGLTSKVCQDVNCSLPLAACAHTTRRG